jgi:hypothetical protein
VSSDIAGLGNLVSRPMKSASDQAWTIEERNPGPTGIDAYAPAEMAARVERAGVSKVHLPPPSVLALSLLAGAFIAFGGMFYTLAIYR